MQNSGIIYYRAWDDPSSSRKKRTAAITAAWDSTSLAIPKKSATPHISSSNIGQLLGVGLIALALGGLTGPLTPFIRLEGGYRLMQAKVALQQESKQVMTFMASLTAKKTPVASKPDIRPVKAAPLTAPDGSEITPVDSEFGLIIPKIGVNAKVIPAVNPANPGEYEKALTEGVAHASTSYFPNENGTVYLFSHSTSYDWFVKDLNAVFYLLKNLDAGDTVAVVYKGATYTYKITEKKVVSPEAVAYLTPQAGVRRLILQTCWPPGSTTERLLIFADLISDPNQQI